MDWLNLIVGFVLGIGASLFAWWIVNFFSKAALRRRFQPIAGEYTAYPFMDKTSDKINYERTIGKVRITYKDSNVLQLYYMQTEEDSVWEAVVWMETPSFGSMVWQYTRLKGFQPPKEHRFDFKRCFVSDGFGRNGEPKKYFYIKGDPPFYKEAFEKNDGDVPRRLIGPGNSPGSS